MCAASSSGVLKVGSNPMVAIRSLMADAKGNHVGAAAKCTVTFQRVGDEETCMKDEITPPYPGEGEAAVDVSTDPVPHPPVWDYPQFTGAGSGSVQWQPS